MNCWLRSYLFIFENTFMTKAIKFNDHKFNILITYAGECDNVNSQPPVYFYLSFLP